MNKNKVLKNASWIIVNRVVQSVLGLFISMFTARYLGPSNYGVINYAASLVAFVTPIMYLGLSNILVQEFVNNPEKSGETIGTAITMSFVSAIVCIIGIASFAYITNANETETVLVCALYSILLIFQAVDLIQYWFQAKLLSKYTSIVSLIAYLFVSAYKIFLLVSGKSVYWFAISNAIDYMIIALALIIIYKKIDKSKLKFSFVRAKEMFSKSRHYIVSSLMVTIFAQTDRIMIKHMIGNSETGFYSAAVACASLTGFVFVAIIDSFRPLIFESKKISIQSYQKNMIRLYSVIIYLSLLQSLFITLLSKYIILILYGNAYMDSVPALRIIVWYTTFSYLGSVRNIWILAENKQKYLWIINLSGALCNVILNYILIPVWGICGASFASLATQIFTNVIVGYIINGIRPSNILMLKALDFKYIKEFIKTLR
ncbi:MAG: flippase [Ruminococcaceae bacterium]|nr:flippase [Oscillospiraceae bacterium]